MASGMVVGVSGGGVVYLTNARDSSDDCRLVLKDFFSRVVTQRSSRAAVRSLSSFCFNTRFSDDSSTVTNCGKAERGVFGKRGRGGFERIEMVYG